VPRLRPDKEMAVDPCNTLSTAVDSQATSGEQDSRAAPTLTAPVPPSHLPAQGMIMVGKHYRNQPLLRALRSARATCESTVARGCRTKHRQRCLFVLTRFDALTYRTPAPNSLRPCHMPQLPE
jgi:hypothetical protein